MDVVTQSVSGTCFKADKDEQKEFNLRLSCAGPFNVVSRFVDDVDPRVRRNIEGAASEKCISYFSSPLLL